MSRTGKKPISIPSNVEVKLEGNSISVEGPKGALLRELRSDVLVEVKDKEILVSPKNEKDQNSKAFWGLTRALIANMVEGVINGYEKKLEIQGVGYKANVEGKDVVLGVGFSHPVRLSIPEGISVSVEKNIVIISGINKESVGQFAANIRKVRPPEPYKGKGIRYVGEVVRRKMGKRAATAGAK